MTNLLKKYFDEIISNDKIGHAFLICNCTYDSIKNELDEIVSNHFFNNKKIETVLNDYIIVNRDNNKILKEDILNLQANMMSKSTENDNRVYVINGADKMNDFASNSLLKFLEEPEENIYAFLTCENINKVLPTVKSRCHVIILEENNGNIIDDFEEELVKKCIDVVKLILNRKLNAEAYIYDYIDKKEEKNNLVNLMKIMKYFYYDLINYKLFNRVKYFNKYENDIESITKDRDITFLSSQLISINRLENVLEYNVNTSLFVDKLIIELGSDINEK